MPGSFRSASVGVRVRWKASGLCEDEITLTWMDAPESEQMLQLRGWLHLVGWSMALSDRVSLRLGRFKPRWPRSRQQLVDRRSEESSDERWCHDAALPHQDRGTIAESQHLNAGAGLDDARARMKTISSGRRVVRSGRSGWSSRSAGRRHCARPLHPGLQAALCRTADLARQQNGPAQVPKTGELDRTHAGIQKAALLRI